jgi:MFS family permease
MCQANETIQKKGEFSSAKSVDDDRNASPSRHPGCGTHNDAMVKASQRLASGTVLSCVSLLLLITGASLTFPHLQSRRDELGCDSLCYGSMTSARGALGLIGTALIGRLSDKNDSFLARSLGRIGLAKAPSGRRACLYIGTLASLLGFGIAISMDSLTGLWLSMIPGALLQHNFDVFKALISEYHNDLESVDSEKSDPDDKCDVAKTSTAQSTLRSGSVGKLGMSAGLSFMIGPMVAAALSPSFITATYLAMMCTLVSGFVIYRVPLPLSTSSSESEKVDTRATENITSNGHNSKSEFTLLNMVKLRTPASRAAVTLLVIRLNMALAFHIFNTIWPSSLKARFQFGPTDHARFMSFVGLTYALSQGIVAKRAIKLCGSNGKVYVIMVCCLALGIGRYIAYYTTSIRVVYASFLFIINALGILNTVITADTGSIAPSNELGGLFGILQSAESAAGMIGPFLGGMVSHYFGDSYGISAPLMAVVGIYTCLFFFVLWGYDKFILSCVRESNTKKSM